MFKPCITHNLTRLLPCVQAISNPFPTHFPRSTFQIQKMWKKNGWIYLSVLQNSAFHVSFGTVAMAKNGCVPGASMVGVFLEPEMAWSHRVWQIFYDIWYMIYDKYIMFYYIYIYIIFNHIWLYTYLWSMIFYDLWFIFDYRLYIVYCLLYIISNLSISIYVYWAIDLVYIHIG